MKPATYRQVYIHIVFAVEHRKRLLKKEYRQIVFKYISGIIENKNCKSIIVNGYIDHVHILVGLNPSVSISDLVRDIKRSSSMFINQEMKWFDKKFSWQKGYGVFSYAHSQLSNVYNYVNNQEHHHSKKSFKDEYLELLSEFNIKYDERFLFNFH